MLEIKLPEHSLTEAQRRKVGGILCLPLVRAVVCQSC